MNGWPMEYLYAMAASVGIFEVLAVLGKDESLARLRDQAAPTTGLSAAS